MFDHGADTCFAVVVVTNITCSSVYWKTGSRYLQIDVGSYFVEGDKMQKVIGSSRSPT